MTDELADFLECVLLCHLANPVKRQSKGLAKRFYMNAVRKVKLLLGGYSK